MTDLKILQLVDGVIDDPRVISAAITGKNAGFKEYFCGIQSTPKLNQGIFESCEWINIPPHFPISRHFIPKIEKLWNWYPFPKTISSVEKQLEKIVDKIKPDIIHAHNITIANAASTLGIPIVVDDHELYSVHVKALIENSSGYDKFKLKNFEKHCKKLEKKLGEKYPIITVSQNIADHHKKYCSDVFVLPNYPPKDRIKSQDIKEVNKGNLNSVYFGTDDMINPSPLRNIQGLYEIFSSNKKTGKLVRIGVSSPNSDKIKSLGFLPMKKGYSTMQDVGHIGLLPWKKHWFHKYCCPNKCYEYAHCGLWLIVTEDIKPVVKDFGKLCDTIDSFETLENLLTHYNEDPDGINKNRKLIQEYAKKYLIWEKVEKRILDAYKIA